MADVTWYAIKTLIGQQGFVAGDVVSWATNPPSAASLAANNLVAVDVGLHAEQGINFRAWRWDIPTGTLVAAPEAPANFAFHTNNTLLNDIVVITGVNTWQVLGGFVSNPNFFVQDLTKAVLKAAGVVRTQGVGVELRLVEDDGTTQVVLGTAFSAPNTSAAWRVFAFNTSVALRSGTLIYFLEGRLTTATLGSVRFTSAILLEAV